MSKITWAAGNHSIIVEVIEYLDRAILFATIDGRREPASAVSMLEKPTRVGDKTIVASIGRIGLVQERLDQINDALSAKTADIDASAAVQTRRLIAERRRLMGEIALVLDAAHEDHVGRIERASATGIARAATKDFGAAEAAARAALAAFDASHPEVAAEMEAIKAADHASFVAAD